MDQAKRIAELETKLAEAQQATGRLREALREIEEQQSCDSDKEIPPCESRCSNCIARAALANLPTNPPPEPLVQPTASVESSDSAARVLAQEVYQRPRGDGLEYARVKSLWLHLLYGPPHLTTKGETAFYDSMKEFEAAGWTLSALTDAVKRPPSDLTGEGLFVSGDYKLHSGSRSPFKINCDALTDSDLETIAAMLVKIIPAFGSVEGIPRGGLRLAEKLSTYATKGPLLIVDDVLTTGSSMEQYRAGRDTIGAVIFARGVTPDWIKPLFIVKQPPSEQPRAKETPMTPAELRIAYGIDTLESLQAEIATLRAKEGELVRKIRAEVAELNCPNSPGPLHSAGIAAARDHILQFIDRLKEPSEEHPDA